MSLPIDPTLLPTFLAVLDTGRISAAAKVLHLSQPAISAQMRKLEESLGVALLIRSVHGVAPTGAGLKLERYSREIQRMLSNVVMDVGATQERLGPLRIAASTTVACHVLPNLLKNFRVAHRNVEIQLSVLNTDKVVDAVRGERVPIGLVEGYARAPGVRLEPFLDDEIVPVMGRDASFRIRSIGDLENVPLLWRESGSGTRAVVARALVKAKARKKAVKKGDVELGSTEAILGGTMAGIGIAFVSRWSIRTHLAAGAIRLVPGLDLVVRRTFRWALPAGGASGSAALFYALAQRTAGGHL